MSNTWNKTDHLEAGWTRVDKHAKWMPYLGLSSGLGMSHLYNWYVLKNCMYFNYVLLKGYWTNSKVTHSIKHESIWCYTSLLMFCPLFFSKLFQRFVGNLLSILRYVMWTWFCAVWINKTNVLARCKVSGANRVRSSLHWVILSWLCFLSSASNFSRLKNTYQSCACCLALSPTESTDLLECITQLG